VNINLPTATLELVPLVKHLATWGEISRTELAETARADSWISTIEACGMIRPVDQEDAWIVTPAGEDLLRITGTGNEGYLRGVLFAHPLYRRYLLGVLLAGLVSAARAGLLERVENWLDNELLPILGDLNSLADEAESAVGRLVDRSEAQVIETLSIPSKFKQGLESWDRAILGQSGNAEVIFAHALVKFAPHGGQLNDKVAYPEPPCVLRPFPLNAEDGFQFGDLVKPAGWNRVRRWVRSGIPIYRENGELEREAADSVVGLRRNIQDALLEHPFYAALMHLVIAGHRAEYGDRGHVEVMLPGGNLACAEVRVTGRWSVALAAVLPDLVRCLEVRPILAGEILPTDQTTNLLRNLLAQEMLVIDDGALRLHSEFSRSLVSGVRRKRVTHSGRQIQARLITKLTRLSEESS
jgi:hypothetical protein